MDGLWWGGGHLLIDTTGVWPDLDWDHVKGPLVCSRVFYPGVGSVHCTQRRLTCKTVPRGVASHRAYPTGTPFSKTVLGAWSAKPTIASLSSHRISSALPMADCIS